MTQYTPAFSASAAGSPYEERRCLRQTVIVLGALRKLSHAALMVSSLTCGKLTLSSRIHGRIPEHRRHCYVFEQEGGSQALYH